MTVLFLAAFAVGALGVLSALFFDFGHGDGLPFLSLTSMSAALLGAGTGGLVADWSGLGDVGSGVVAALSAVALIAVLHAVVMPYIRRQQANSHQGRASYIGLLGTVTLELPAGGWGEVSFVDTGGNRVRARAKSTETDPLPKATPVYIADVDADYIHVVAVPDL
ncbi:NfeD family protein [Mycobacterium sp. URHB0044]|jgi:membrane protein implicated in regulation of membrane protease activity|uniref:NfeD family protein n=1 Tax=Mycobacterium sp. URHB0044 TaxID=1380386 RepID=UPI00048C9B82|nr:NfeD family protein [Mycobacterium sp. URHB0044]